MSDDSVAFDVEGGPGPAADPAPPPAADPAQPAEAAAPPAEPVEPEAVEVNNQRFVPLAALAAVREENRTLKEKAGQLDQVQQWYHESKPYVDFLKANPDLLKPREATPAPAAAPPPPESDPALVSLARTLDLYTPEGKPDAARAAALADFMDQRASGKAEAAVKPLHEQTVQQQVQTNFQHALGVDLNGMKPDPTILRQVWARTDPKQLATQEGAASAVIAAIMLGSMQQKLQPAPTAAAPAEMTPPVVTEAPGGRNINRPAISEFETRVIKLRGIDQAKYTESLRGFRPGEANVLEE